MTNIENLIDQMVELLNIPQINNPIFSSYKDEIYLNLINRLVHSLLLDNEAYKKINFKFLFEKIKQKEINSLCIVPCSFYVEKIIPSLKKQFKQIVIVDNFKKYEINGINIIDEESLFKYFINDIDSFFISALTPRITKYFQSKLNNKNYITLIDLLNKLCDEKSIDIIKYFPNTKILELLFKDIKPEMTFISKFFCNKLGIQHNGNFADILFSDNKRVNRDFYVSENKKNVVFIAPFFDDIYDKINLLLETNQFNVYWARFGDSDYSYYNKKYQSIYFDLEEILYYIKYKKLEKNTIFIVVTPIHYYYMVAFIKDRFPDSKVVHYAYDFLNLFCPYKFKNYYKEYTKQDDEIIEMEYHYLNSFLKGDIIDGIIYKDGGEDFYLLKEFKKPKLFFPTVKSKKIFILNKSDFTYSFIFMGSLYSEKFFHKRLFSDVFLFDVFKKVLDQDFNIDVYYAKNTDEVADDYREYFKDNPRINFIKGKALKELFKDIDSKYGFGWLIYDDDFEVVREHIKIILPSKIFAYMALGVPIVVVDDLETSAKFIAENEIGIVISRKDITNLKKILASYNYEKLKENVYKTREIYCLENYKQKFIDFINQFFD